METPSFYADANGGKYYDCTGHIGGLLTQAPWPMYSYDRPGSILWNAIAGELYNNGWTDDQIKEWLQSKSPRWALDGSLGDKLEKLGKRYAKEILAEGL